ncbi:MAG: hypothetical protein QF363_03140 [Planctomycetaceae bacterium]|jgi:hypothetical protein|nr:hypothetical protein [Planctomycetaceae bacterium]
MTELEIGGVVLGIEYRNFGGDRGPSVKVFGDSRGERVQLLRFDCFEDDPHYHYDPTDGNRMFHIDTLTMGDAVAFTLDQLATNTRSMVERAGFADAALGIDQAVLAGRIDEVRQTIAAAVDTAAATAGPVDGQD